MPLEVEMVKKQFKKLKKKCRCGCGDFQVKCIVCGFKSGYRHRFNHMCITDVKILKAKRG